MTRYSIFAWDYPGSLTGTRLPSAKYYAGISPGCGLLAVRIAGTGLFAQGYGPCGGGRYDTVRFPEPGTFFDLPGYGLYYDARVDFLATLGGGASFYTSTSVFDKTSRPFATYDQFYIDGIGLDSFDRLFVYAGARVVFALNVSKATGAIDAQAITLGGPFPNGAPAAGIKTSNLLAVDATRLYVAMDGRSGLDGGYDLPELLVYDLATITAGAAPAERLLLPFDPGGVRAHVSSMDLAGNTLVISDQHDVLVYSQANTITAQTGAIRIKDGGGGGVRLSRKTGLLFSITSDKHIAIWTDVTTVPTRQATLLLPGAPPPGAWTNPAPYVPLDLDAYEP